jgi:hypothetical protein
MGCSVMTTEKLSPARFAPGRGAVIGVTTTQGQDVKFDRPAHVRSDTVFGEVRGARNVFPLKSLSQVWVEHRDQGKAASRSMAILGGMVVLGLIGGAILKSL